MNARFPRRGGSAALTAAATAALALLLAPMAAGQSANRCWPAAEEGLILNGEVEATLNTNLEGPDLYTSCWRATGTQRVFLTVAKEGAGSEPPFTGPQAAGEWIVWENGALNAAGDWVDALHSFNALTGRRGPVVSFSPVAPGAEPTQPAPEHDEHGNFLGLRIAPDGSYTWTATRAGTEGLYAPNSHGGLRTLAKAKTGESQAAIGAVTLHGSTVSWTQSGRKHSFRLAG